MIFVYVLGLLLSFYLLMKVCDDYFVDSLEKISKNLKMSSEAAGATLMAMGSSAPELFVSLIALLKPGNHGAMGAGTIVGSAIFNILVIIGASLVVRKAHILWQPVVRDMAFYCIAILMLLFAFSDGVISLTEAFFFVSFYAIYIVAVIKWKKLLKYEEKPEEEIEKKIEKEQKGVFSKITSTFTFLLDKTFPSPKRYYWVFTISIAWIMVLSWLLVESGVYIAEILNIPEVIIGLTILAWGTSVPDLISSLIVAKNGKCDMAISNAVGSNIFDILFGLGFPWLITILFLKEKIMVDNTNLTNSIILLFATVICIAFLFVMQKWKLGKKSGWFLLALYAGYFAWLVFGIYK